MSRVNGQLSLRQRIDAALQRLSERINANKLHADYHERDHALRLKRLDEDARALRDLVGLVIAAQYAPRWRDRRLARRALKKHAKEFCA